ncbi:hypothetical protein [Variovorax sp. PBL-H6]|uniref:hypothetical protein n=1 Tax=Variovorax sp. PBL-H6 TaxID=434009 RepID=UPI0013A58B72|nr:hypothetical protein [Variovorax sp. PBL-H6]
MPRRAVDLKPRPKTGLAIGSHDAQSGLPGDGGKAAASLDPTRERHAPGAGFLSLRGTGKGLWDAPARLIQNKRDEWS